MWKKVIKASSLIIFAVFITSLTVVIYNHHLDLKLAEFKGIRNSAVSRSYGLNELSKGITILDHDAKNNNLIILGSSEFGSNVPQNPRYMFPNSQLNCDVDMVGKAYVQDLLNAVKISSLSDSFKNKKVVIIVSVQWFMQSLPFLGNQIDVNGFNSNFSELQFYRTMNNNNLSADVKKQMCKRIFELSKGESSLERTNIYAYLYSRDNIFSRAALTALKPYYSLREYLLSVRDKQHALERLIELHDKAKKIPRKINWDEEDISAGKWEKKHAPTIIFM